MCGICGFIDFSSEQKNVSQRREIIHHMISDLALRGPNESNSYFDIRTNLTLGHTRLSIQDISSNGSQPMFSKNKKLLISFNGEIYNHLELRKELEQYTLVNWQGHSDTETLICCFAEWGVEKTLQKINGMFAISLFNLDENTLYLIRDRAGEKPLYYGIQNNLLLFGSELKIFKRHPDFKREVCRDALSKFIQINYIPSPLSIYKSVKKIPPGTYVKISLNDISAANKSALNPIRYWNLNIDNKINNLTHYDQNLYINQLDKLLHTSIERQMIGDVPLGLFLSGGIDSTLIASIMQKMSKDKIQTFTIGFNEKNYDESLFAKNIANFINTDHHLFMLDSRNLLEIIPNLPNIFDEPFADKAQLPAILLSKMAKSKVTVALSGDGGDELFAGYSRYTNNALLWRYIEKTPSVIISFIKYILKMFNYIPDAILVNITSMLGKLFSQGNINRNQLNRILYMLNSNSRIELNERSISHQLDLNNLLLGDKKNNFFNYDLVNNHKFSNYIDEMANIDFNIYLPDDILVKVDRSSMYSSLETRVPFLDYNIIEFAYNLPLSMKINGNQSKWILREVLKKYVPENLFNRPKAGFNVPIDQWLRGPLREWTYDMLNSNKIKNEGFFNHNLVSNILKEHMSNERDWHYLLWNILNFESWLANE